MSGCSELLWSKAVKERDGHQCVACGESEELSALSLSPEGVLKVQEAITLCPACLQKGIPTPDLLAMVNGRKKTIRLNVNMDGDVYARLAAAAKVTRKDVSTVIRQIAEQFIEEVERG